MTLPPSRHAVSYSDLIVGTYKPPPLRLGTFSNGEAVFQLKV